jgi:hypothetical protein
MEMNWSGACRFDSLGFGLGFLVEARQLHHFGRINASLAENRRDFAGQIDRKLGFLKRFSSSKYDPKADTGVGHRANGGPERRLSDRAMGVTRSCSHKNFGQFMFILRLTLS